MPRRKPPKIVLDKVREVAERAADQMERNITAAVLEIERIAVQKVSRGQRVRRQPSGRLVGLDPSSEGEPPKVVSARLKQSITHDVERDGLRVRGRVGSNVKYARRLELGFSGTDKAGSNVNQGARPYLRPSLAEARKKIKRIMKRGA